MERKTKKLFGIVLAIVMLFSLMSFGLVACGSKDTDNQQVEDDKKDDNKEDNKEEQVAVTDITLELSSATARIGETVTATVKIRPTNATNKEYSLSTDNDTIAVVAEDGTTINCLARGSVTITARSKGNTSKKDTATLTVLGADENGRYENLFEAEYANIVANEGSGIKSEIVTDDRITGEGVVGNLNKYDRLIWGVNSSEADNDAILKFSLMGPSGWIGMWDSIPYTFADWYTVKVNGKVVDTEAINVEGTNLKLGYSDYYAVKEVTIGSIALNEGLNVITLVVTNRYDQTEIHDGTYDGNLGCWGNIDSMTVLSSKTLTYVADTAEVEDAEPDINANILNLEVESAETRIYENADNPQVDISAQTFVEFKQNMNVIYGLNVENNTNVNLTLKIAAPYVDSSTVMQDIALDQMISINLNGKNIDIEGLIVKGNDVADNKENYTELNIGWIELLQGENSLGIVVKSNAGYEYLGGLDCAVLNYFEGTVTPVLVAEPEVLTDVRFEVEAATTKLVGYEALTEGATYVELKDAEKVQTDVYANKLETTKIIFGMESDKDTFATIKIRIATPYIDESTEMTDVSLGSLGDLWVNGTLVSTPNILSGNNAVGTKENFVEVEIGEQVELHEGKNRIAWEPQNYTGNAYDYFGALDYIEVSTTATLTPYEVNFWTDRNTYFDDGNNEPIYVTCDRVSETNPDNCWIAVYRAGDSIEVNSDGSLYYYYPTNEAYNSDGVEYLGTPCNIVEQNKNSQRDLITALTGGHYVIVYFEWDSKNSDNGYTITDYVNISVWDDPGNYAE